MTTETLPSPASTFGQRVRERLQNERLIWLTTVGQDGTPQPNPVWFVWDGADEIAIYSRPDAYRLRHIAARPQVSLHFNSGRGGDDIVVLLGTAEDLGDALPPHESPEYAAKYGTAMARISGSAEAFSADYSTRIRVTLSRVRGF
jgi:PPOX class probable F420-dependent enzyme